MKNCYLIFPTIIMFVNCFRETSSESSGSDSTYSESSSEESSDDNRNAPRKQNVLVRRPALVRPAMAVSKPKFTFANMQAIKKMTPPRRRAVKDRFYDRSRDIPNDVYFGDVKGDKFKLTLFKRCES